MDWRFWTFKLGSKLKKEEQSLSYLDPSLNVLNHYHGFFLFFFLNNDFFLMRVLYQKILTRLHILLFWFKKKVLRIAPDTLMLTNWLFLPFFRSLNDFWFDFLQMNHGYDSIDWNQSKHNCHESTNCFFFVDKSTNWFYWAWFLYLERRLTILVLLTFKRNSILNKRHQSGSIIIFGDSNLTGLSLSWYWNTHSWFF